MPDTFDKKLFNRFQSSTESIALPEKFTYPFFYEPHPLCLLAAKELQDHLNQQEDWNHDFGIDHLVEGVNVGKMFGVLVVRHKDGEIGYLSAFSGRLADQVLPPGFVPPVVDILKVGGFFRKGEKEIEGINREVETFEQSPEYVRAKTHLKKEIQEAELKLAQIKALHKKAKQSRDAQRKEGKAQLGAVEFEKLETQLKNQSKRDHFEMKDLKRKLDVHIKQLKNDFSKFQAPLDQLKKKRRKKSQQLQNEIFEAFEFLNIKGETRNLLDIFSEIGQEVPPSGAGECAMPKLLQYAFAHDLRPMAMAEFWWGQSPKSEIRKHGQFYPSCKGKCEPILSHMLEGMEVETSPLLSTPTTNLEISTLYEDEVMLVISKPEGLLSVPGKTNKDSVLARMEEKYPEATGPIIVHRLDRATSGLILIAKTKEAHKALQEQFISKTTRKRYVALLDGVLSEDSGEIDLPLRVDLEDRPRQLVCYEHGKPARTRWEVIERRGSRTRVNFYPITGRTHQLRVHAAHHSGLNAPIIGDNLYGQTADRLYLHAEEIEFIHPVTGEKLTFTDSAPF